MRISVILRNKRAMRRFIFLAMKRIKFLYLHWGMVRMMTQMMVGEKAHHCPSIRRAWMRFRCLSPRKSSNQLLIIGQLHIYIPLFCMEKIAVQLSKGWLQQVKNVFQKSNTNINDA
mmetsp:Transcript_8624/g.16292  ORF Transcript_8624/g.16292 Transcript_8624/m.16292 type:complete len:116 (+) Transcript_8624:318-665(+)